MNAVAPATGTVLGVALSTGGLTARLLVPDSGDVVFSTDVAVHNPDKAYVARCIERVIDECRSACRDLGGTEAITSVGLSIGGHVDQNTGTIVYAPGLFAENDEWSNVPFAQVVSSATGLPVYLDNDVACMAEFHRVAGEGRGVRNFATVYLASEVYGIGCGLVVEDSVVRGASGGAGEFGHIVVQPGGPRCRCGNRGCLQAMLHVPNLVREVNWGGKQLVSSLRDASCLAADGNPRAMQAFARAGRYLGQGFATLINLLNPKRILLGGPEELVTAGSSETSSAGIFMDSLRAATDRHAFSNLDKACTIVIVPLNMDVASRGAAYVSLRQRTT